MPPWDQLAGITKAGITKTGITEAGIANAGITKAGIANPGITWDQGAGISKTAGSRRCVSNRVTGLTHQNAAGRRNRGKLEVHFVNKV